MPSLFTFRMPQEPAQACVDLKEAPLYSSVYKQMFQYYPVYVLLPWEQPQQTAAWSPPQTGQQLFEEQMPFYTEFGYIPQQAEPTFLNFPIFQVRPGGQQQPVFDPFLGTAPEPAVMPAGRVLPNLQKEMINFKHTNAGIVIPSTSQKPSTSVFTSAIDPTITPELMKKKAKTDNLKEP
ncbi:Odontogenic ameloblast-associated protein [Camelus dromedarius]|uniref:Odontogenic ameloblast-associated protein n=1 Tax=Camelus dromedarius TaxID=9838 RepID=A0A5N4EHC5_CAMDR|nr:Odontogenic ameloblast-associated protein [Camelus dromedarius]